MAKTEAQKRAQAKYIQSKIKRVPLNVQKEYYDNILVPAADMMGEPIATFIKIAIEERLDRIYGKLTES